MSLDNRLRVTASRASHSNLSTTNSSNPSSSNPSSSNPSSSNPSSSNPSSSNPSNVTQPNPAAPLKPPATTPVVLQASVFDPMQDIEDLSEVKFADLSDLSDELSDGGWDTSIGKTSTLSSLEEQSVANYAPPAPLTIPPQPYYVQGLMRNGQGYLITNLCGGRSTILVQPQMTWTIGRNRDAAIPLRDRMLSRHHAVLLYLPVDGFHFVDLNSMNGSYVNGVRVEDRVSLKDGDVIRVGHTEFFFFLSRGYRNLEAMHPEVLKRLLNPNGKGRTHVDYAEIREEISFNLNRS